MAPMKRYADGDNAMKKTKHSSDDRAQKRLRKSENGVKESSAKPAKAAQRPPTEAKPATSSVLQAGEKSFPRGGASILTPLEHKQIQIEATKDVLFEQSGKKQGARNIDSDDDEKEAGAPDHKAAKKRRKGKDSKTKPAAETEQPRLRTEGLSYRRLAPGSMVLGQITEVTSRDVVLALPNNLLGFVPHTAISDQLTQRLETFVEEEDDDDVAEHNRRVVQDVDPCEMFLEGQYLRAYVTSTEDTTTAKGSGTAKKKIELSINPRLCNIGLSRSEIPVDSMVQASVISVEDHGLVMDLGLGDTSIKGFMSSKEVGYNVIFSRIEEGAVFLCLVTGTSSNGKIVKLSADYQKAGNVKKTHFLTNAPSVDNFLPGTAVELLVTEVSSSGLAGQIMGMLDATADLIHSGAGENLTDLEKKYAVGTKVKARVICTFPNAERKRVGISLLPHVVALSARTSLLNSIAFEPQGLLPISSYVEEAKVRKVEPSVGLFMDVGVKGVLGFAHISRLSEKKIEALTPTTGAYKLGSTHRARVIGFNPIDGVYLVSLEQRVLDQPFLRVEEVKVGEIVKGKVEKIILGAKGVTGVTVILADGVSGLVPEIHMADVHLQHPERKFREGMPVTARVLSTDLDKRQIRLTLKKTLVNSEADILSGYCSITPGAHAPGTIIKLLPRGALVQFYNNICAFLPVSEMSEAYIKDPAQHFRVGQTINVHVLDVSPEEQRMTVSCIDPETSRGVQQTSLDELQVGSTVSGSVTEKSGDMVNLELEGSGLKALLRLEQLTDGSESKNTSFLKKVRVGQKMQDLIVLEKLSKRHTVILSNKPSLVTAAKAGTLVTKFSDIHEGLKVNGFVRNITPDNVYLEFGGGIVGLLLKTHIPKEMTSLPTFGLRNGQSTTATVLSIDPAQQRFLLTMRTQTVAAKGPESKPESTVVANAEAAVNPVDGESTFMAHYSLGKQTVAQVTSVKDTQLNVKLADNIQGRIDMSELFDSWDDIKDPKRPLRKFKTRDTIPVRILGIHDARNHRFLPISHRVGKVPVFELSAKCVDESGSQDQLTMDKVKVGSSWVVFVNNHGDHCIWVNLSPNVRGRIDFIDLADDVSLLDNLEANFPVGSALKVQVKAVDASSNRLDLVASTTTSLRPQSLQDLTKGAVLAGRVTKVTERYIMVQLSENIVGMVTLTEFVDDFNQANPTLHEKNDVVRVCVVDVDAPNKKVVLSLRPSQVLSSSLPVKDPQILSAGQLKINDVVRGFVKNVSDKGVFVSLGPTVTAYIRVSDLSDSYIKDWKAAFEIDQLVEGKILAVDEAINHVQMSLKASVLDKDYAPPLALEDLKVGQIVTGKVRKVEDFGVFIVVDNSNNVSGLCHRSEIANEKVEDVRKLYDEGDVVKAIVLKIEKTKRRVNFGFKASYFQDTSADSESSDDEDAIGGVELDEEGSDEDAEMEDGGIDLTDVKSIGSAESEAENSDEDVDMGGDDAVVPTLGLSTGGFDWNGETLGQQSEKHTRDSEDEDASSSKKKKKKKPEIKVDKTGDLDKNGPQSVADYERQLLGQPNSSSLWIQYMAFQLQLNEVEKAREIAERALRTINMREDEDKMNVWIALLNLENAYGSDETLEDAFKRACQYNDVQDMHERLISIYIESGKHDKADTLFQTMMKNKSITASPSYWLNYATFLTTTLDAAPRARALLPRALQSLSPAHHQHRHLTAKFGALEFQSPHGDAERGRTIFEGLIATWPKRWDLWDMLLDLERSQGETENVRMLFERMSGLGMKKRRARVLFKKWLEFEEGEGNRKAVERVKAKAAEYVERLKGAGDE